MLLLNTLPAETPTDKRIILATNAQTTRDLYSYIETFGMYVGAIGLTPSIELIKPTNQEARHRHIIPPLFLDAKVYQDEPYAMRQSMGFLLEHFKPRYITVPAAVSSSVLRAAVETIDDFNDKHKSRGLEKRKLIMSLPFPNLADDECVQRYGRNPLATAEAMTMWALENGLDGLVCGPRELPIVKSTREAVGMPDFSIIVAGIRSAKEIAAGNATASGLKYQVCTASDALQSGADAILVGSAVTHAQDRCAAFHDLITNALTAPA